MWASEHVLIGSIALQEAKRIQSILSDRGIQLQLLSRPEDCCSGRQCTPTVEVYAPQESLESVQAFFAEERARQLDGLEVDPGRESLVFDPAQEEATCPACGTRFKTTLSECPDCGLGFGAG